MAVDWTRVRELQDEIGKDDFLEVAELFLAEVESALLDLPTAEGEAATESEFHFIKSSALNLGFSGLAALCAIGEGEAAANGSVSISPTQLSAAFQSERAELLENIDISGAAA